MTEIAALRRIEFNMKKILKFAFVAALIYIMLSNVLISVGINNAEVLANAVSPSTSDINIMIIVALILLAAFMLFIFFNKRHRD